MRTAGCGPPVVPPGFPAARWARAKTEQVFAADLRSLAAFRVALALVVLLDLASRASDLSAHYTDTGVLPRAVLLGHDDLLSPWTFSVNLISGGTFVQELLFGVYMLERALPNGKRTTPTLTTLWGHRC
jgi:hypothetical protein